MTGVLPGAANRATHLRELAAIGHYLIAPSAGSFSILLFLELFLRQSSTESLATGVNYYGKKLLDGCISVAATPREQVGPRSANQLEAVLLGSRASEISANVAFSASLTATPPNPRNPPSVPASAAFCATP